jgi:hypothetical protein
VVQPKAPSSGRDVDPLRWGDFVSSAPINTIAASIGRLFGGSRGSGELREAGFAYVAFPSSMPVACSAAPVTESVPVTMNWLL